LSSKPPADLAARFEQALSPELQKIVLSAGKIADQLHKRAVIVGGAVRDLILKRPVVDVDIMLEAPLEGFIADLSSAHGVKPITHPEFLTYTLHIGQHKIDIVTAREESYPKQAQLPVVKASSMENDFKRRDFSINSLAMWINGGKWGTLFDHLNASADLEQQMIRVLHDHSFSDDPTRLYRAARFASRYNFKLEANTLRLVQEAVQKSFPSLLSPARRRREFELVLKEPVPLTAIKLLAEWGLLSFIHADAALQPAHQVNFTNLEDSQTEDRLIDGLIAWFSPWGKAQAEALMTTLSFERTVKSKVLGKIS
jgi:tRNA nucleotidyltransferase (CCA-adding enzyme)